MKIATKAASVLGVCLIQSSVWSNTSQSLTPFTKPTTTSTYTVKNTTASTLIKSTSHQLPRSSHSDIDTRTDTLPTTQ